MYKITIKRADDSIYWEMCVGSQEIADLWIAEEQTRPYWDPTYTVTVEQVF